MLSLKTDTIGCVYVTSYLYMVDKHPVKMRAVAEIA